MILNWLKKLSTGKLWTIDWDSLELNVDEEEIYEQVFRDYDLMREKGWFEN